MKKEIVLLFFLFLLLLGSGIFHLGIRSKLQKVDALIEYEEKINRNLDLELKEMMSPKKLHDIFGSYQNMSPGEIQNVTKEKRN